MRPASMDTLGFWQILSPDIRSVIAIFFAASQAGLVNNLNDGIELGDIPALFASFGLGVERIGTLKPSIQLSGGCSRR